MKVEKLPETQVEAIRYFAVAERCHDFVVSMRWPDGVRCAHCGSENVGKLVVTRVKSRSPKNPGAVRERRLWNCASCRSQFTTKTGTIFEDSPLGLELWLPAVWMIVNAKNGVSSCELARALGITQKSAWHMGHRIRTALHSGNFEKMESVTEVDETYVGGKARNMHKGKRPVKGTGGVGKAVVMGLLERHPEKKRTSRVIAHVVPDATRGELVPRIRDHVTAGSELHTDAASPYRGLEAEYAHKVVDHAETYVKDNVHTNGLENFWSLLKRTLKGTYVAVQPFHLFRYLDEQAYRFNERKDDDQSRFVQAVQSVSGRRLTYKKLIGASPA